MSNAQLLIFEKPDTYNLNTADFPPWAKTMTLHLQGAGSGGMGAAAIKDEFLSETQGGVGGGSGQLKVATWVLNGAFNKVSIRVGKGGVGGLGSRPGFEADVTGQAGERTTAFARACSDLVYTLSAEGGQPTERERISTLDRLAGAYGGGGTSGYANGSTGTEQDGNPSTTPASGAGGGWAKGKDDPLSIYSGAGNGAPNYSIPSGFALASGGGGGMAGGPLVNSGGDGGRASNLLGTYDPKSPDAVAATGKKGTRGAGGGGGAYYTAIVNNVNTVIAANGGNGGDGYAYIVFSA